jgi:hypothetical protein
VLPAFIRLIHVLSEVKLRWANSLADDSGSQSPLPSPCFRRQPYIETTVQKHTPLKRFSPVRPIYLCMNSGHSSFILVRTSPKRRATALHCCTRSSLMRTTNSLWLYWRCGVNYSNSDRIDAFMQEFFGNVNAVNLNGRTPLHVACGSSSFSVIQYLVQRT